MSKVGSNRPTVANALINEAAVLAGVTSREIQFPGLARRAACETERQMAIVHMRRTFQMGLHTIATAFRTTEDVISRDLEILDAKIAADPSLLAAHREIGRAAARRITAVVPTKRPGGEPMEVGSRAWFERNEDRARPVFEAAIARGEW